MPRFVEVQPPSFPRAAEHESLPIQPDTLWQVLCGDAEHWRAGVYSPLATGAEELPELERHTCPELFLLLSGRLTLVVHLDGGVTEMPLEVGKPVLVTAPHSGYCPDGPHTGTAFVVERDVFATEYRMPDEW